MLKSYEAYLSFVQTPSVGGGPTSLIGSLSGLYDVIKIQGQFLVY